MVDRNNPTYKSIAKLYDEYVEIVANKPELQRRPERALPPQRPYTPTEERDMGRMVFAGIGFVIGVLLLVLAAWAFAVSAKWAGLDRSGATVGYFLVGFFAALAGAGGIIAVWNHNFRVLTGKAGRVS